MGKRGFLAFICMFFIVCALPMRVSADLGPKPSVTITFTGLEGEKYYAALLSEKESVGPHHAYHGTNPRYTEEDFADYDNGEEFYKAWKKFLSYEDKDGFYFLQDFQEGSGEDTLKWGYYPPEVFKLLLYFPEYDSFAVSDIYEKYAFDSYYLVQMEDMKIQSFSRDRRITVERTDGFFLALGALAVRIALTILIELVIALLFGFRERKQMKVFGITNIITQLALNAALAVLYTYYRDRIIFWYLLAEMLVFAAEAMVYSIMLPKISPVPIAKKRTVLYAWTANIISFGAGILMMALEIDLFY